MKFNETKLSEAVTSIKVDFDSAEWSAAQEKAYEKLAKEITVKGFRKGEVPVKIAKKHISTAQAMQSALDIIIPQGIDEILKTHDFKLLSRPQINVDAISVDALTVSYVFTTRPSIKLANYKGITIKKQEVTVTDEDVKHDLEMLARNLAVVIDKKDAPIAKGDIVNFDFEGYTDGKAFEGGKAENYSLEIGSGQFVPGFEDQLIGHKAGERCEVNIKFPENYVKELAGKDATFKIFIHNVKEKKIPEIDDELAKDAQLDGVNNLEQLKEAARKSISARKNAQAENMRLQVLVDQIVAESQLEVPQTLIDADVTAGYQNFVADVEKRGIPFDKYCEVTGESEEKIKERITTDVIKNLRTVLVLTEIAKENKITVNDDDIANEIKKVSAQYKVSEEEVKKAFANRMMEIQNKIFSEKINAFLQSVNTLA